MRDIREYELGDELRIYRSLVVALDGDVEAAYVWSYIRSKQKISGGEFKATGAELQDGLVLRRDRLRRALESLRERGYLSWRRASSMDATSVYTALIPGNEGETK